MDDQAIRLREALRREEVRAEVFANHVRLLFLTIMLAIAVLNASAVSAVANRFNLGALLAGYCYGGIVYLRIRRKGYHPVMKYMTSCLDIVLVFGLLALYTGIDIPAVALKHTIFLALFPLIALTGFRYDRVLTIVAGACAICCYIGMIIMLTSSGGVKFIAGGYEAELFSKDITVVGQLTKILILSVFVYIVSSHASYSRGLFQKVVQEELRIRKEQESTEWELRMASRVQINFLPHELPHVQGLECAGDVRQGRYVGGDYYDFIRLSDHRLCAVIADVSGNGVPAALIMSAVRAGTHLLASLDCGLENFIRQLHTLLLKSTEKKNFVTVFAAEIDVSRGTLTYINAGHPAPVLFDGQKFRALSRHTTPLGIIGDLPDLEVVTESFMPGMFLAGITDGLIEQPDCNGVQYGEERLNDFIRQKWTLPPADFVEELLTEMRLFAGTGQLKDDAGCVAIRNIGTTR
jgi:serine phosphatase RsbU (regulator of sigma subunit)